MPFLYVTPDNQLRSVNYDGTGDFAITADDKIFQVTNTDNADNGQVWVLSSDPDTDPAIGGDLLMVSVLDTSGTPKFTPFAKPGGKKFGAKSIAAGKNGCYFVEEDDSIHYVDKDGNESEVFPAGTALEIQRGAGGLIVLVSNEIDMNNWGNIIKWFRELPGVQPTLEDGGNDKAVGSQAVVQNEDEIIFMQTDGTLAGFSPGSGGISPMAFDSAEVLRLISNGGFYAISKEVHNNGGSYIKNIGNTPATKVDSSEGVVNSEFTSLNTELFK